MTQHRRPGLLLGILVLLSLPAPLLAQSAPTVHSGELAAGDQRLSSGEYFDRYTFQGRPGERVVVDLRSQGFDSYLMVRSPSGQQFDNDDHEGSTSRSLLSLELTESGEYAVIVTSYQAGETGRYVLRIERSAAAAAAAPGARVERGTLAPGDRTLRGGEYYDAYTFEGTPGQRVRVDLRSSDFDTYLMVVAPGGEQYENDDFEGSTSRSVVERELTEGGTYRVLVTSYAAEETGAYELTISTPAAAAAAPARPAAATGTALQLGRPATGRLAAGDATLESGEYLDRFHFDGQQGQNAVFELTSRQFDTYLMVITPSGQKLENDDFEGSTERSRIELRLRESGRYQVVVTSYSPGETGDYTVAVQAVAPQTAAAGARAAGAGSGRGGRVYGVFVGISEYPDPRNNLRYTARDAHMIHDAMVEGAGMRREDAIILTDSRATAPAIRQAIETIGGRVGADDLFVFFYSGHGSQVARPGGPDRADPDGLDETLAVYGSQITDDEFGQWLEAVRAGTVMVALDACYSGGFSKDIIDRPNRIGFFSSEEDVPSMVAMKFEAGGFLSVFLAEAIGQRRADQENLNGDLRPDGLLTAMELSQYIHERYRLEVTAGDDYGSSRQLGYQHLVVDRGGIRPNDVLIRW